MESPKPAKKRRLGSFINRNRAAIVKTIVMVAILAITAGVFYNLGQKQGTKSQRAKNVFTNPDFSRLKESTKENLKKAAEQNTTSPAVTRNSGFFRLNGTIQSLKKDSFTLKLADGSVIALAITDKTKYYTGTPRAAKPTTELKAGSTVTVTGTIAATGSFGATIIQAQK